MKSTYGVVLSFFMLAGVSFADGLSDLETSLRTLQTSDVTFEALGRAYKLRTNAVDARIAGDVAKACAAGLLYVNRQDFYTARIRPGIPDAQEFELTLRTPCAKCDGQGKVSQTCSQCGGSGKCKSFNCHDGQAEFKGLNGRVDYRPCPACKGTGNCPKCNGGGVVAVTCSSCMGRGGAFSSVQALKACRDYAQKSLDAIVATRQGLPLPTAPAVIQAAEPAQTVKSLPGMPVIPKVMPPPDAQDDPEIRTAFNGIVDAYYAQRVKEFKEYERIGWNNAPAGGFNGENKQAAVRAAWFEVPQYMESRWWIEAEQKVDAEREKRAELAEIEAQNTALEMRSAAVSAALRRAKDQVEASGLLKNYSLSADDAKMAESDEYTSIQRKQALENLWNRSFEIKPDSRDRYLFIPVPSGLVYTIQDVRPDGAHYELYLVAVEAKDGSAPSMDVPPRGTFDEIGKALLPTQSVNLENLNVITLDDDSSVLSYQKGQNLTSGEWIIPVLVNPIGGVEVTHRVYRSDSEFRSINNIDE